MLLNITNHPSSSWQANQLDLAKDRFGELVDIPFPKINPELSSKDLTILTEQFYEQLLEKYDLPFSVHIMGEQTFTFYFVGLLQKNGINCIASTTERIVETKGDQKVSTFKFIQFREYPKIN